MDDDLYDYPEYPNPGDQHVHYHGAAAESGEEWTFPIVRWLGIIVLLGILVYCCYVAYAAFYPRVTRKDEDLAVYVRHAHAVMTGEKAHQYVKAESMK